MPTVAQFDYEPPFLFENHHIKPDFLLYLTRGDITLVEIKASWIFTLSPDHKVWRRLDLSKRLSESRGWGFEIWTEKELWGT